MAVWPGPTNGPALGELHLPQDEPFGLRERKREPGPTAHGVLEPREGKSAGLMLSEGADQFAHHAPDERAGAHLDHQPPSGSGDLESVDRAPTRRPGRDLAAERTDIKGAGEELRRSVPDTQVVVRPGLEVAVRAALGFADAERRGDLRGRGAKDRWVHSVELAEEGRPSQGGTEGESVRAGAHPSVGTARDLEIDIRPGVRRTVAKEPSTELALHRAQPGLPGPPRERRAVVPEPNEPAHSPGYPCERMSARDREIRVPLRRIQIAI